MNQYTAYERALDARISNDWAIGDALVEEAGTEGDLVRCEQIARAKDVSLSVDSLRQRRFASAHIRTQTDRKLLSPGMWVEALRVFPGQSLEVVREEIKRIQTEGEVTRVRLREEKAKRSQDILTRWAELWMESPSDAVSTLRDADAETRAWVFRTFPAVEDYIEAVEGIDGVLGDVQGARDERKQETNALKALEVFRADPVAVMAEITALPATRRNKRLVTLLSSVPPEEQDDLREEIEEALRQAVMVNPSAVETITVEAEKYLSPQRLATQLVACLIRANGALGDGNEIVADNEEVVVSLNDTQREAILEALRTFGETNDELQARLEIGGVRYVSDILD